MPVPVNNMILHTALPHSELATPVPNPALIQRFGVQRPIDDGDGNRPFPGEIPGQRIMPMPIASLNPALLQWRNPQLGGWMLLAPQPRAHFALPVLISPVSTPVDTTLFEEPQNAALKHYLPAYTIAMQGSGGATLRQVSFAPSASGFTLTVHLTQSNAAAGAGGTPIVPTTVRYFVSASLAGRALTWDFDTITANGGSLVLSLTVSNPADRNNIYQALTTPSAQAQLILRRSFTVASLVPNTAPPTAPVPTPTYRQGTPAIDTTLGFSFDPVLDHNVFALLGGGITGAPSEWQVIPLSWQGRSFHYYQDPNQPTQVYFLPDAFKISRRPTAPHGPSLSISSTGTDPNPQMYVVSFLAVPVWDPRRLQDAMTKLATQLALGTAPTITPFEANTTSLALNLPVADGSPALVKIPDATIDISAGISAAVSLSLQQLQQVYNALFDDVSLLLSGTVTVTVGQGTGADVMSLPVSARAADFAGSLFNITSQFDRDTNYFMQTLTNAIESPLHVASLSGVMMQGDRQIATSEQKVLPSLPTDLKPASAAGSDSMQPALPSNNATLGGSSVTPADGLGADTTISAIGSVVVSGINAASSKTGAGNAVSSILSGVLSGLGVGSSDLPQPAPNSLLYAVRVNPNTQIDDTCAVLYDLTGTRVLPDPDALWDVIMQNGVLGPIKRSVQVMVFSSVFTAATAAGGTASPLRAIQVVFESGQTANFDMSTPANQGLMTQTVSLAVSIKSYILREGDSNTYKYRVSTIHDSGPATGDWISSNQDSFYVEVNA